MKLLKIASSLVAFLFVFISYFPIAVSGIGIVLTYASIPFFIFSKKIFTRNNVKIYWSLFLVAHLILAWRIWDDLNNENTNSHVTNNPRLFKNCSEKMFKGMNKDQKILSAEQKTMFSSCMNQKR